MKRMLINANQKEEIRIALVEGQLLYDLNINYIKYEQKKSNIYKGIITRIEPSLEAVFVNYGSDRHGFLPIKEISSEYFSKNVKNNDRLNIKNLLKEGQEIIVQINKEERRNKGAALTTFISLAGTYLVLMPNNPLVNGISRRIEGENREELKKILPLLKTPNGMGIIIRTAGIGKPIEILKQDLECKLKHWNAIKKKSETKNAPYLIHQESNILIRSFRDYLYPDIKEILIDNLKTVKLAKKYIEIIGRTEFIKKIKFYNNNIPIFTYYKIESQIESAFQRKVRLPSGGILVIDTTEALTAIDINSSKSTKGIDIEETAFNTNLEAVYEIARQLRLRDLSGLIVIDFIDMNLIRHQREVENKLKEEVKYDRAKIQIEKISKFGLLEMSRQRLNPSLCESSHYICPRCNGKGIIRDNASLSLAILRLIEEEATKKYTKEIHVIVPIQIASYLINEKRQFINTIENRQNNIRILIIPDNQIQPPQYNVIRIKKGEKIPKFSYHLAKFHRLESINQTINEKKTLKSSFINIKKYSSKINEKKLILKSKKNSEGKNKINNKKKKFFLVLQYIFKFFKKILYNFYYHRKKY